MFLQSGALWARVWFTQGGGYVPDIRNRNFFTKNAMGSTCKRDNRVFCAGACGSVRDAIIA